MKNWRSDFDIFYLSLVSLNIEKNSSIKKSGSIIHDKKKEEYHEKI